MVDLIKNFKSGPLDVYRKKSTFDWKKLKLFLESEEVIKYENDLYEELQQYSEFRGNNVTVQRTFEEERIVAARQSNLLRNIKLLSLEYTIQNFKFPTTANRIRTQFIPSAAIKFTVSNTLFVNAIYSLGTGRHVKFITDIENGKISGCYCLTEIGHGSNAKGMQTTATYNKERQVFILNSKDFQAAKCWAGGLGQTATHALVYAHLIVNDVNQGLHCFIVPVRDPDTLLAYPGITVGDMGVKIGLNGIDNGFLILNNYEIPRENLLNKLGDITDDGQYVTPFKDKNKRHGAALGTLSGGRVMITAMCEAYCTKALTIALRYAAIRRQFGPTEDNEVSLLEYQTHQYRLFPHLATTYVLRVFSTWLVEALYKFNIETALGSNKDEQAALGMEIHAISSASKAVAGWITKYAIQECRETCGGHGYLKAAGIGSIRDDHDANLTYEGENYVLIQQNSNWLLKLWPLILNKQEISSPLESINFLTEALNILEHSKFNIHNIEEICSPKAIIDIYQWLVCYLLKKTYTSLQDKLTSQSHFWAKSSIQVFKAKNLSTAFIQHLMLQIMLQKINEAPEKPIRDVLLKLFALFGLCSLEGHISTLYEGCFATTPQLATLREEAILMLCSNIKNDAIALIDVIAPPDFILNSVLGSSDGEVYKRLQTAIFSSPQSMSRPSWWEELKPVAKCKL
ncbi:peroxisomal acyl-coenzyme A oxidase 3-like [Rhynchophorus ferrugineus]|uniref:peroxisomal acyl-coenzyme A oxidase 3-like n=1 Tax=Rhynchophorus ferrugineus TaxID=354439 RepID=UPI003FCD63F3